MPTSVYDIATELALIAFTIAIVYSFKRLFADTSFFVPIAAVAISAHVTAAAVRWARGGLLVSAAVSALAFGFTTWILFPPTTLDPEIGFGAEALGGYITDLGLSWDQFKSVSAPAEVTAPFLLLIAITTWVISFLSDWAAFRLRSPGEALIPGVAVFIFGSFFAESARVETTVFVLGTALALVLFHRLGETSTAGAWLGSGAAEKGQASLFRVGMAIVAATLIGGVGVAQALPGYDEPPIENFDPTTWDDPADPRVVLSPLVDIQSRLIEQPDVEVFTVQSPVKDYWRITSLDVFDGRTWRSRGSFEGARGELETNLPNGTVTDPAIQTFDINRLGKIWLPAAYEPAEILSSPEDIDLEYEPQSGTLIVSRDRSTSDGLTYSLLSAVPRRDVETIAAASSAIPDDIAERYLDLPADFSDRVRQEAAQIVVGAGAETPYEQALALQNYFRDPTKFSYSLDVSAGHRTEQIEDFLFENRTGYCEQFSGSFAAMARSIGLPARVAVGFTPGEWDPAIEAYRVTGKHAHAWPEVWIDGIGWLRFEPTPGRGAPGDEAYTGQQEEQQDEPAATSPDTTVAPEVNPGIGGPEATTIPERPAEAPTTSRVNPTSDRAETGVIGGAQGFTAARVFRILAIASALILLLFAPLAFGSWRSHRRHRSVSHDPAKRIGLAWAESRAALQVMGVSVSDSETPKELVKRVEEKRPETAAVLSPLANEVTNATYASGTVDESRAVVAEQVPGVLAAHAREDVGGRAWWLQHANPVNVLRDQVGTWRHLRR